MSAGGTRPGPRGWGTQRWLTLVLCGLLWASDVLSSRVRYDRFHLVEVGPLVSEEEVNHVNRIRSTGEIGRRMIFFDEPHVNRLTTLLVAPSLVDVTHLLLTNINVAHRVLHEDYQSILDKAAGENNEAQLRSLLDGKDFDPNSQFLQLTQIYSFLDQLDKAHPVASVYSTGNTYEGRPTNVLKISTGPKPKPGVWLECGIHAREWISPATCLYIATKLLTGYANHDPYLRDIVKAFDWHVQPVTNPDGYEYTHTTDRLWRKNRRVNNGQGDSSDCDGVDLNRNFGFHWKPTASSSGQCSECWAGTGPFSEPESKNLRGAVQALVPSLSVYFSIHSFSQMWLIPYSYDKNVYPADFPELMCVSKRAVEAIERVNGLNFTYGQTANTIYACSGTSHDWVKGDVGAGTQHVKHSYGIELRPLTGRQGGFDISPANIQPSGEEFWAGIQQVVNYVRHPHGCDTPELHPQ